MLGSVITGRAQIILNDTSAVRWSVSQLVDWLNEGQKATVRFAPEANVVSAYMQLAPGTRQNLTSLATTAGTDAPLRLIDIPLNVTDATGLPSLRAIRLVNRRTLDQYNPDWATDTAAAVVQHYIFDSRNPREFYVYPPQPATGMGYVEIVYSAEPADLADETASISLPDAYAAALVDYVVHRALSADIEYGANSARVAQHFNQFMQAIQGQSQADLTVEPVPADTPVESKD